MGSLTTAPFTSPSISSRSPPTLVRTPAAPVGNRGRFQGRFGRSLRALSCFGVDSVRKGSGRGRQQARACRRPECKRSRCRPVDSCDGYLFRAVALVCHIRTTYNALLPFFSVSCAHITHAMADGSRQRKKSRRAKQSTGLNFCLMCLANVLTVRNTTKFLRKENIIRYFNIYSLQHQHWCELKN